MHIERIRSEDGLAYYARTEDAHQAFEVGPRPCALELVEFTGATRDLIVDLLNGLEVTGKVVSVIDSVEQENEHEEVR